MKLITGYIMGFISCALFALFHIDRDVQAEVITETETVYLEYQVDMCHADDIGLKKLTTKDIEDLID